MAETFPAAELRRLLESAREADRGCKQFGAGAHRYRWNPPASEAEVEEFERETGVRLPEEYRNFLLLLGDGGAGPFYGLFSLGEVRKWLDWEVQPEKKPRLYPGMAVPEESCETDEEWEECRRGIIPIGSQGDSYFTCLMVSGPDRGRVVYIEDGMSWVFFPREQGFLPWYVRWLREVSEHYHIFWFGTNLDGDEAELRSQYGESGRDRGLVVSSMRKFPVLSQETKEWIVKVSGDFLYESEANWMVELLWQVSPEHKDNFLEERWEAGLYGEVISEVYYSIHHLHQDETEVLEQWGRRIFSVMSHISQKCWYLAFSILTKCPWLTFGEARGLWDVAGPDSRPELIRALGRFKDAGEHLDFFLEVLEEREDLKVLNGAVMAVPVVRDERLRASLERICHDFPYTMGRVEVTDWNDEEQVARWDRRRDENTVCHNGDIVLEQVRETFINPEVSGTPRPRRFLLQVGDRKGLGIDEPHPPGGIAVHPLIAVVIREDFGRLPADASDWDRVLGKIETLTLRPEERYRRSGGSTHWIYMVPPEPRSTLAKPYYYDLRDWSLIGRMGSLKTLTVERLCVDDFSFLSQCGHVETLSLYNTNFSDCRQLLRMTRLKKADLRRCRLEHEEALDELERLNPGVSVRR